MNPIANKIFTSVLSKLQNLVHYVDLFINFVTKEQGSKRNEVLQQARTPILFGGYIIFIFVILGGIWASIAPLNSAAIAVGTVIANTKKKSIQHQHGGIIKEIFVKQGDVVNAGDKLIELDSTNIKASYDTILNQYLVSLAHESRLIAERDNLPGIELPEILIKQENQKQIEKIIRTQNNLFQSRLEAFNSTINLTNKEIEQLNNQYQSLQGKKNSLTKNLSILRERIKANRELLAKGFAKKITLLELEGNEAELKSNLISVDIEIAKNKQEIKKKEIYIINIQNQHLSDILRELKEVQLQVNDSYQKYLMYKDQLDRIVIRSPVDGIINELKCHTKDGVIGQGSTVAEIIPIKDKLVIEAKIPHRNIDSVSVGLKAKLRFSAFKSRTTPLFSGTVISISPDIITEQNAMMNQPGNQCYAAIIELDMEEFEKIAKVKKIKLYPGMQAEIQIITGTKTLLRYLLDPVSDCMFKAFREK